MTERVLRVMQSFKPPRATTNPYIVMLDRALDAEPSIAHLRFGWRTALFSRLDVVHFHWPEVLLEGDRAWKRWGKRMLFRLLLVRLVLTRTATVRTVHNLELPSGIDHATRQLLLALETRVDRRIVLNETTQTPDPGTTDLIPHGHYRDWFAGFPRAQAVSGRFGYFGLIRKYKGIESLLSAYADARRADPALSLSLGGKPSSVELEESVAAAASRTPGIHPTLRFLDDAELVEIATSSELIVLPYRFMHNSGGALAALSLDRPVLLPRNEVNELLATETGPGWVHLYDGELTADALTSALAAVGKGPHGSPDLSRRSWHGAGAAYARVYRAATRTRRTR